MMTKLDARDVEWLRAFTLCRFKDALRLDEYELSAWVDEAPDEPGTRDAIDLGMGARDVLQGLFPLRPFRGTDVENVFQN